MKLLVLALVFLIALEHIYFAVLEIYYWEKKRGIKIFGHTRELARITAKLAKNQGVYNLFLAAGLIWSLYSPMGHSLQVFFLNCVLIAGIFGGITVRMKILWLQALPALITLTLLHSL